MTLPEAAVLASIIYFVGFGAVFVARPAEVARLGLRWNDAAGKTEVRCYYGALSWALAAFLGCLLTEDLAVQALTGVLFLAIAVLATRIIGATVDGGWSEAYNRQAIPVEGAFVIGLAVVRLLA